MKGSLTDRIRIERRRDIAALTGRTWDEIEDEWAEVQGSWDASNDLPGDGAGNTRAEWIRIGPPKLFCRIQELRGDEQVLASRLEGVGSVLVFVRANNFTRGITADDRIVDLATNRVLNVRYAPPPGRGEWIALTCETGVAT